MQTHTSLPMRTRLAMVFSAAGLTLLLLGAALESRNGKGRKLQ